MGLIPIGLMGVTYSIYVAALWPMVPLVVKASVVGSAYGLCTAIQNIGLAIGPSIVGAVTNKKSDIPEDRSGANADAFIYVNIVLGGFAFMGVLSSIALLFSDKIYTNGILQKPGSSGDGNGDYVDILASPHTNRDEHNLAEQDENLRDYVNNDSKRTLVRKSIARSSVAR
mmetsp:Transcript_23362/g.20753  ORF Transcript_23362/g.20753 Transcript_23362/m.20753 type:complete len:171 (+) Transcript_23362:1088-1600(+)|eukprot:CAMPEP_0205831006 /NCGR_PEP_ID=MMETSP0206-20130828/42726_1 /ASSEMBLY_ACC=CAM_ASM_000279 /TAXON_ID=36767 /ORGANISM="Euplotes focardii, Strain TN1" /LENGTH=170 /DNA_ID=CAMNT_0053135199 /DNA_START=673 /DNA_END=1182 /DNA_ORIENTATION=-